MKNNLQPKELNQKSTDILLLLYRFRFLTRSQIQTMLRHKYHSRVLVWINELVEYGYILKFYEKSMMSDPAIYCLDKEGRKYLKKTEKAELEPLSRVWKEKNYSMQFRHHCLFLADIYIKMAERHKDNLRFKTKTDLYGVENLISPISDALFTIEVKRYFLDIFDDIPPIYMRMRVKQYFEYYNSDQWQDNTDAPFPEIILICPNPRLKSHLYHFIKNKINDEDEPVFYLATKELVTNKGLCKECLQKVEEIE
jgi:hypothetical protein